MSHRKLQMVNVWGCSNCDWIFKPNGNIIGVSIPAMEDHYRQELNVAFAEHNCNDGGSHAGEA